MWRQEGVHQQGFRSHVIAHPNPSARDWVGLIPCDPEELPQVIESRASGKGKERKHD